MDTFEMELGGRKLIVEHGKMAKQANGAVLVRYGDTAVLVAATMSAEPREGVDFFPLTVDYEEKQSALDETLYRIDENETKLVEVTEELNEKHAVLEKRVRDIYINGQISYLDVLFGAKDFGDFLTRMDLLKRVMIRDSELV